VEEGDSCTVNREDDWKTEEVYILDVNDSYMISDVDEGDMEEAAVDVSGGKVV
jgi:hypothetical protein